MFKKGQLEKNAFILIIIHVYKVNTYIIKLNILKNNYYFYEVLLYVLQYFTIFRCIKSVIMVQVGQNPTVIFINQIRNPDLTIHIHNYTLKIL